MFKVYTYNYDAETDTSWNTFEYTLENLNGLTFADDNEVNSLNTYIQSTIYSTQYSVVGIIWIGETLQFVTAPIWVAQMLEKHTNFKQFVE